MLNLTRKEIIDILDFYDQLDLGPTIKKLLFDWLALKKENESLTEEIQKLRKVIEEIKKP